MSQKTDRQKLARVSVIAASLASIAFGISDMLRSLRRHS